MFFCFLGPAVWSSLLAGWADKVLQKLQIIPDAVAKAFITFGYLCP